MLHEITDALTIANIVAFLKQQVTENQFSQGALVAGVVGATIAWGRGLPGAIWSRLKRMFTIEVRFNSDSPDYQDVSRFITDNVVREWFSRKFVFQTDMKYDNATYEETVARRGLAAGYGNHFGLYRGRPVFVDRSIEDSSQTKEFKETITLTFLGRGKKKIYRFAEELAEATEANKKTFDHVPVFINEGGWWNRTGKLPLRHLSSVFTSNNAGQRIVDLIRDFEGKRDEHHRLGLPHHTGIMLHGEPGTGKSSLIHAIASETQRSIHYLNLGSVGDDGDLTSLLNSAKTDWSNVILAIEDIDAAGVKVNRASKNEGEDKNEGRISLSALLNVLDGILCPDGLVVIATTNHHEQLDPALKRPGRFDHTVNLGKLGHNDFIRMSNMFGRDPRDFEIDTHKPRTGSEMRAIILEAA